MVVGNKVETDAKKNGRHSTLIPALGAGQFLLDGDFPYRLLVFSIS